jgi:hypothetical protein
VSRDSKLILIQASAGLVPTALADGRADVVLAGVCTLGGKEGEYRDACSHEVPQTTASAA